jgi:phosphoribosyl 1,2-cyclic phosphate phosphodiesterase
MKLTVLGCGTSTGVPMIGCSCEVCTSSNPKNKRFRSSILVTGDDGANILVDTTPDFRSQCLASNIERLDAIIYTHSHADHIFGLDDIRSFNYRQKRPMPVYAEPSVLDDLQRIYQYIFRETQKGGGKPQVELDELSPLQELTIAGIDVLPMRVYHGRLPVLAFKFGPRFAYVTDVSEIPPDTWEQLKDLDLLMLDAVRIEPHETHFHLDAALEVIAQLQPKRALLTHLAHDYDYAITNAMLPAGVELAYDGQIVEI